MKNLLFILCAAIVVMVSSAATPVPSCKSPEKVDLGLSVKWASCNLGASTPDGHGRWFAWGDVVGKDWNGSCWSEDEFGDEPPYRIDSNNNLLPEYDAAHVLLGGTWRMPTKAEFDELIANCTSTWTDNYNGTGIKGRIFTSNKPGYTDKSIFLPAAGFGNTCRLKGVGFLGSYWSCTFGENDFAWFLYYLSDSLEMGGYDRYSGQSIRPVSE